MFVCPLSCLLFGASPMVHPSADPVLTLTVQTRVSGTP